MKMVIAGVCTASAPLFASNPSTHPSQAERKLVDAALQEALKIPDQARRQESLFTIAEAYVAFSDTKNAVPLIGGFTYVNQKSMLYRALGERLAADGNSDGALQYYKLAASALAATPDSIANDVEWSVIVSDEITSHDLVDGFASSDHFSDDLAKADALVKIAVVRTNSNDHFGAAACLKKASDCVKNKSGWPYSQCLERVAHAMAFNGDTVSAISIIDNEPESPLKSLGYPMIVDARIDVKGAEKVAAGITDDAAKAIAYGHIASAKLAAGQHSAAVASFKVADSCAADIKDMQGVSFIFAWRAIIRGQVKAGSVPDLIVSLENAPAPVRDQVLALVLQQQAFEDPASAKETLKSLSDPRASAVWERRINSSINGPATRPIPSDDPVTAIQAVAANDAKAGRLLDPSSEANQLVMVSTQQSHPQALKTLELASDAASKITDEQTRAIQYQTIARLQAMDGDCAQAQSTSNLISVPNIRARAYAEIGAIEARSGDIDGAKLAIAAAKAALGDTPADLQAYPEVALADAEMRIGNLTEAKATADGITIKHLHRDAYVGIAMEQARAGDVAAAVATIGESDSDPVARCESLLTAEENIGMSRESNR